MATFDSTRKQPKQARSQAMVEAILDAAVRVFRDVGYAGATTNRIAKVAGVSVGSLYQYFEDKDAIARALVGRVEEEMLARMQRVAIDDADLRSTVTGLIDAVVTVHEREPELVRMFLSTPGLVPPDQGLPEVAALVRSLLERHRDEVRVPDLDLAAWMLVTAIDAILTRNETGPRLGRKRLRDQCVRLAMGYLGTGDGRGPARTAE